ncbi:reverse transcriptase domain-containing protein [Tanacetum coccineum]
MPNNVKTYDGTGDPEDHLKIFQAAAQVERWAMPTWCHMFNSTLIGAARVWFDELPPESINGYKGLKAAFLAYFMQQKKYVKDPVEIRNIKQRDGETIEDFMKQFKVETGRMKGAPECMRISGFMHGEKPLPLPKRKVTHRGNHKTSPNGMLPSENLTSKSWQRTTKQKLTQSFAYGSKIMFPPLANSDGTEGPLVIEAEIGGHMIHRMYIDGDHCIKAWMDFMIVRPISPYNGIIRRPGIREIQAVPSIAHGMLKFPADGGIVTICSIILIPAECVTVITSPKEIPKVAGVHRENIKVAIHPNFPDQEVAIRGTLSLEGNTKLCTLLKKNLDIFAWQPSDMTGVPRSIAEHRLNIREGYSPV